MMMEEAELGLSLGLRRAEADFSFQLNLMPSSVSPPQRNCFMQKLATPWKSLFVSDKPDGCRESRSFWKGIDVNRLPSTVDNEDEPAVSSPNSTVSSVSGKRSERDRSSDENEIERTSTRAISDEEDGDGSRKKLRLSKDQSAILEESFKEHNTLNPKQKQALASRLNLRPRQVEVWFQNRRARTKLKQTEVDCEFLKRCCENLTEENRRLQKEVQELRALKLSPQLYMHMNPPTTLTMCPSCERISVTSDSQQPHATRVTPCPQWVQPLARAFDAPPHRS